MECVIEIFLNEAAKARDWHGMLNLKWALACENDSEWDLIDRLLIQKSKGG